MISPGLAVNSGQLFSSILKSNFVKLETIVRNLVFESSIFSPGNTGIATALKLERWLKKQSNL